MKAALQRLLRLFVREVGPGELVPALHGLAWAVVSRDAWVTIVVPFNVIGAMLHEIWLVIRWPARVSANPRAAYRRGFADGQAAAIRHKDYDVCERAFHRNLP